MNEDQTIPDLSLDQTNAIRQMVVEVSAKHIERLVSRMWKSVIGLALVVAIEGLYISYISGTKVEELDSTQAAVSQLQAARNADEIELSAVNANLQQIETQLDRIERDTKP